MSLEIKAAIIDLLKDHTGLEDIKTWFNYEPAPQNYTTLFAFVEWMGGPIVPEASTKKVQDDYAIVIARKSTNSEDNENAVITLCAAAEALLEASPTLSGTTFDSWVSNREVGKYPYTLQRDYEIAAVRITLTTWRYK